MRNRRLTFLFLAAVLVLACSCPLVTATGANPPGATSSAATQMPAPPDTPTLTATPLPTYTPTTTPTPTPTVPIAWPKDVPVNCRFGPGTGWIVVGGLNLGQTAEIAGKNEENTWWYVRNPSDPGSFCWVSMSVTNAAGNLALIPVTPTPVASVTKVTVKADLSFIACGGPNPVEFSGTITTNGPTKVSYRWEVGGDKSNTTSPETINFTEADTKTVTADVYKVDCGNYHIILHVLEPNDKQAKKNFTIP